MIFALKDRKFLQLITALKTLSVPDIFAFVSAVSVVCNIVWFHTISSETRFPYLGILTIYDYLSLALTVTPIPLIVSATFSFLVWINLYLYLNAMKDKKFLSIKFLILTVLISVFVTRIYALSDVGLLNNEKNVYRVYLRNLPDLEFFVGLTNGVLVKKANDHTLVFFPWSKVNSIEAKKD